VCNAMYMEESPAPRERLSITKLLKKSIRELRLRKIAGSTKFLEQVH
jgi:hypothetical protein